MTRRTRRSMLLAAILGPAFLAPLPLGGSAGQDAPKPAQGLLFKSGVELITVDVSVVDKTGRPVRLLRPDQFDVSIDGRPRRVVSAELVEHAAAPGATGPAKDASRPAYSSNDTPETMTSPGRLIFIAVDQGSFRALGVRGATEAAKRFVSRLQPNDRLGLLAFPPPGPAVAASKNHAAVLDGLKRIVGSADPVRSSLGPVSVGLAEAIDIGAGDPQTEQLVSARECAGQKGMELQACVEQVRTEAADTARRVEFQAARSLNSLRAIVRGLSKIPERKTLVLISTGLPTADRFGGGLDTHAEIASIAREAAKVNANIYVLHVDSAFLDAFSASERGLSETLSRDASIMSAGLDEMAGASGGTLFRATAGSDFAFDRVLLETSASYLLGVEPAESDRNGKPHAIKVSVKLPGVEVRNRKEFLVPPEPVAAAAATPENQVVAALRAGRMAQALPLGVSTRTLGRRASGTLRVLVTANVGRGLAAPIDVQFGYVISDAAGNVAFSTVGKERLSVAESDAAASASYVSAVDLKPGDYTLRFAAVDPGGRVGSVDHAFLVGMTDGDGMAMSDLLLLHPSKTQKDLFPVADGRMRGPAVDAHLELHVRARGSAPLSVLFGAAERAGGEPLVQTRATVAKPDAEGRSTARARLDLSLLPPGDYVAVAIVSDGKRVVGRREQPLRIEAAAATVSAGGGAPAAPPRVRFSIGDASLVKPFAPTDVLAPAALAYFAGRLQAADRAPATPGVTAAAAALRGGQFETVLTSLKDQATDRLSVVFLKGVALLAKGELEPAASQFREALRIADDFLPAAFYLGACYAAGGRDREAIGAWQTALVTESEVRIVYDVLADALLRLDDGAQAFEILREARSRWPDDAAFPPRLAAAQAMLQRRDEALGTLDDYLAGHASDAQAAALAVRLIYEVHAAGGVVKSQVADRELAAKYAGFYRSAGGSNPALIDRWVAFIGKS